MKPKTKAFADKLMSEPKISHTEAYLATHTTTNRNTARTEATKLLAKPSTQIYMQKHIKRAKQRVVELMNSEKQDIALKASESILDRELGKPTTRTEVTSHNLNVNVEASQELSEAFTAFLSHSTTQS